MKNIIFILIVLFLLTGCSQISKFEGDVENNNSTYVMNASSNEEAKLIYLIEQDSNLVSIEVPVFNINKADIIENNIINHIKNYLFDLTGVEFSFLESNTDSLYALEYDVSELVTKYDYYIDIDFRISIQDEDCISIIFEGMLNKSSAAHPIPLFFTYNLNPETGERILFSDKYFIDSNLYNIVLLHVKNNMVGDSNHDIVAETFLDEKTFYNELSSEKIVFCYYTEDYVGISFPINFAMGGHLEVEIPYDSLKQNNYYQ